jgi:heme/copper-type cytochrome/quinol oxidase subunit 2
MKHGQLGHFLVYHVLPVVLIYGGLLALLWLLAYFHKKKKGKSKQTEQKLGKMEILWETKPTKRRRKKARKSPESKQAFRG